MNGLYLYTSTRVQNGTTLKVNSVSKRGKRRCLDRCLLVLEGRSREVLVLF